MNNNDNVNNNQSKLRLYYFTDPLCSFCWVFEPILKKFRLEYGSYFDMSIHMGGLLGEWDGFPALYGDVTDPSDMKDHWEHIAMTFHMPIDGSLWLSNPIKSSYPESFIYQLLKRDYPLYSENYLREIREALFVMNLPIDQDTVLLKVLEKIGLGADAAKILSDSKNPEILELMHNDIELAQKFAVQGFPSLVFHNPINGDKHEQDVTLFGVRPYQYYVDGLDQALNSNDIETVDSDSKTKPAPTEIDIEEVSKSAPDMILPSPIKLIKTPVLPLATLLKNQTFYYGKEISILYDIELGKVMDYCKKEMPEGTFKTKTVLGELAVYL